MTPSPSLSAQRGVSLTAAGVGEDASAAAKSAAGSSRSAEAVITAPARRIEPRERGGPVSSGPVSVDLGCNLERRGQSGGAGGGREDGSNGVEEGNEAGDCPEESRIVQRAHRLIVAIPCHVALLCDSFLIGARAYGKGAKSACIGKYTWVCDTPTVTEEGGPQRAAERAEDKSHVPDYAG